MGCHPEGPGQVQAVDPWESHKTQVKVQCLGQGNPRYQQRLGDEQIESSPAKKDLGVLVDERLGMGWECALTDQKANCVLGCITSSVASRSREVILPLYSTFNETPHRVLYPAPGSPQHRKDIDLLKRVQRRTTKLIREMEHLSYEEELRELELLSLEKRSLQGDLIVTFQYLKEALKKDGERLIT
ncbi:hypothetical protein BTVI_141328 [Pitangus sulphuratus]|nr:hypothetical protein BTVI_141328 [Pitangus sulphuratus]